MRKRTFVNAAIVIVAASVAAATAARAQSAGGYTAPPKAALSADLSAPWVLQLRATRGDDVVIARPAANRRTTQNQPPPQSRPARVAPAPQFAMMQPPAIRQAKPAPEPEPEIDPRYLPQTVAYDGEQAPGTIVIDTENRFLYLVEAQGKARRYGVGVGKPGFEWAGTHVVSRKAEWPDWRPPAQMIEREAEKGHFLPQFVDGGPHNPLGARALYLGSSLYRIHGTNQPWSIGQAVSSGCIRMRNEDVIDLYERVQIGTQVVVS